MDDHTGAFPRFAFPFHLRADFPGSLTDADATEVAGFAVGFGVRVEAAAVVGDAKGEDGWSGGEMEGDLGGCGVFEGIGDRFLGDHADVVGDVRRDGGDGMEVENDLDAFGGAGGEELERFGQRGDVLGVSEVGDEVAGFALDAGDEAAAGFEQRAGLVVEWSRGGGIEAEGETGEFLLQGVVELAGDALAFFAGGLMSDGLFEAGDLPALEGDPDEREENEASEHGDGDDESLGGPKRRGAEHFEVFGRTQQQ